MMDRISQAQLLATLLQKVGFALWQLAELEDMAAGYFVVRLTPVRGIGLAEAEPLLRSVEKKTFGHLVRRLAEASVLDHALAEELQRLVAERNWLVHHAKRQHRGVINRPTEYAALLDRIDKLAQDATVLIKRLGGDIESYVRSTGVALATIDAEAAKIRQSLGYD